MATATRKYTCEATASGMKGAVTSASDSTVLGAGIDVQILVAKTATNKLYLKNALEACMQKLLEETSP